MNIFKKAFAFAVIATIFHTSPSFTQWALDTVISTGANTDGIAITPDNSKIIVTNNTNPGAVKVISTATYAISNINVSSIENYPHGVAVNPDGLTALVNTFHKTIYIDLTTASVIGNYAVPCVGTTLYGIAITPNGDTAVYPDLSSGCTQQGLRSITARVVAGSSSFNQVTTTGELYGIAITADGASAIVTTFTSDFPKKVNLSTFGVENITGFNGSYGVATFHHSNEALIQGDSLKRVSLTSNTATQIISDIYSTALQGIAITADDRYAFVVGSFKKVVVDLASNSVIQTFTAGGTSVATMSDGSRFFVTDSYNGTVRVYRNPILSGVENDHNPVPLTFALQQNFPNPFNPSTNISFALPSKTFVLLKVFNLLGEEVTTLVNEELPLGTHLYQWNAGAMPSGVYLYRLQAGSFTETKKLLLLR